MTAAMVDLGAREAPEGTSCPASAVKETQGAAGQTPGRNHACHPKNMRSTPRHPHTLFHAPNEATRVATNSRVRARAKGTGLWFIAR